MYGNKDPDENQGSPVGRQCYAISEGIYQLYITPTDNISIMWYVIGHQHIFVSLVESVDHKLRG